MLWLLASSGFAERAGAGVMAHSIAEFSGVQGQDHWSYGFYAQGPVGGGPHLYSTAGFTPFNTFKGFRWEAGDAQTGANANDFLSLNSPGGHPNGPDLGQTNLIWAVRRYESGVDALVDISFDRGKINIQEPCGGGITGRIFIDGVEVFPQFIADTDATGVQGLLSTHLAIGSKVDFAIGPTGVPPGDESPYSARAEGTRFSVIITEHAIPEPSAALLGGVSGLALFFPRRQGRGGAGEKPVG